MNKKNYALNFELGNEVARLENANSFDLYILKSKIEKCLKARKVAKYAKETVCGSKEYVYYDVNSEQEEIIEVPIIHIEDDFDPANGIQGFRKRDGKSAFIDFEAIDLTRSSACLDSNDTNIRQKIDRPWELPHRSRVAVRQYIHLGNQQHTECFITGYLGKWNHGSIRLKTLSGETIIVKDYNVGHKVYELTVQDNNLFDKFEKDDKHQDHLKYKINIDILEYCSLKGREGIEVTKEKVVRSMMIKGHEPHFIDECINDFFPELMEVKEEECIAFEKAIGDGLELICDQAKVLKERQEIEHA